MKKVMVIVILAVLTLSAFTILTTQNVKASTSDAKILSFSWYIAPPVTMAEYVGDLVAVGEIQNVGSSNLGYVVVRGLAYNSTGDVVCSAESTAFVTDMTPGQKAPFYLDFAPENSVTQDQRWVPSVTKVTVDVAYANDTTNSLYSGLVTTGVSSAVDRTGTYTVRGVVQNSGNQVAGPVNLITTFYNELGAVVAVNATYVADSIGVGTVAQFVATPTDNTAQLSGSIAKYSLLIQAPVLTTTATPTPTTAPTSTSATPTPTPTLPSPSLSFDCISSTTYSGFNVQIQGTLTYDGTGISGAGIQISYSVTGGATWQDLAYVNTDNNGSFSVSWNPSASGNDVIRATWPGNDIYSSVSTTVNFAVAPFNNQGQNIFSVTSNSTLTNLAFNSATDQLSFSVSGPSGTTGLTEVCIPQSLIPDISKLNVMLDGSTINYNSVSEGNVWLLTFAYHHSSHTIVIALESSTIPEFPISVVSSLLIISAFSAVVMLTLRKRRIEDTSIGKDASPPG